MRSKLAIIFFLCYFFVSSQTLYTKYFVKKNKILLRWAPATKELFDLAVKNGYKITRSYNGQTTVLNENLKPYVATDEKWVTLAKENKNAILLLKALYENQNTKNISVSEKAKQDNMLFNLVLLSCDFNSGLAKGCGLFLSDSIADNSKTYSYKIEINAVPANIKYIPAAFVVNASQLSANPEIKELTAKFRSKNVKLKWNAGIFSESFGGYSIERSVDSISYNKINNSPVILLASQYEKNKTEIIYNDTVQVVKTKYFYRIRGINHFGEFSEPSNVVSGFSYPELKAFPLIDSIKIIHHQKIYVQWRLDKKEEIINVKQFVVLRSEKDSGPYTLVYKISNDQFRFIDEKPYPSSYYKIGAISFGNDTLFSYSSLALIADTIAPKQPGDIKSKVDEKGNVTVTWRQNEEKDLQGYKIFKANSRKEEFVQINGQFIKGTEFKDKLNLGTLTKTIYYCVAATDNNFNTSILSEPIEVKRPDTIAPVAPIIKNLGIVPGGIKIEIVKSTGDDIKNHVLYRKESNKSDLKMKEWKFNDTIRSYVDSTAELGLGYYYKIVVSDEDDNISVSNSPYIKYETGFRKKITGITFKVDRTSKFVELNWNYLEKEVEKFVIYRASKKEPLTIIKTLMYPQQNFIDKTLNMGNIYEYRIKAIYENGAESIISDAIIVEY